MITQNEYALILERCRKLPPAQGFYLEPDYIINLFLAVLDFRLRGSLVQCAIGHYRANHWSEIRTFGDLQNFLRSYPDTLNGNTEAALYLWGYRYWNIRITSGIIDS